MEIKLKTKKKLARLLSSVTLAVIPFQYIDMYYSVIQYLTVIEHSRGALFQNNGVSQ